MGKPPVKSTKALVKAKLSAEAKFYKSNEGREVWLRTQVERLIDKIDPIEAAAILSTTVVVHDLINKTNEFTIAAKEMFWNNYQQYLNSGIFDAERYFLEHIDQQPKTINGVDMTSVYEKLKSDPELRKMYLHLIGGSV
jgi:hypothetical protein